MRTILHQKTISRLQICQKTSSSSELSTDNEIHLSGSNEVRFASIEEIRRDHRLFDERRYGKEYALLHFHFNKKGYLCKSCEIFYVESSVKSGGSRRHCRIMLVIFKDNPGKNIDKP